MEKLTPQEQKELDALALTGFASHRDKSVHEAMNTFVQCIYHLGRTHEGFNPKGTG